MSQRKIEPQIVDFRLIRKFGDHPTSPHYRGEGQGQDHAQTHGRPNLFLVQGSSDVPSEPDER